MTSPPFSPSPADSRRLPSGQAAWADALVSQMVDLFHALSDEARALCAQTWNHMARANAPVVARALMRAGQPGSALQRVVADLNARKLLWFDDDLRAILQCPPFSVLHTPHEVKAFGWDRTFACSVLDIPLTLLVYGPNVWMDASTRCPRSGEKLAFRVRMNESYHLEWRTPPNDWRVWLPPADAPDPYAGFHSLRPRLFAFYTPGDLETHCHYENGAPGVVYTFEQALYLGECLLQAYRVIGNPQP